MNSDLFSRIDGAAAAGLLKTSTPLNIKALLTASDEPRYEASVTELVMRELWSELDDRFFECLVFGTAGLRGRTIGKIVTAAERGSAAPEARPEFPCVGTNALNEYNLIRATLGLVGQIREAHASSGSEGRPSITLAYDTRHFAREFADLVSKVATENGCDVHLFSDARSTPELSFAVRQLRASAGIVLTASHNPPYDNGYKVYWSDGAQIVEPNASGIIARVNALTSDRYEPLPPSERGQVLLLGQEMDDAYMAKLETLLIDPALARSQGDLRIVFSNLHGTGGKIAPAMLRRLGFTCDTVPAQDVEDGSFPTVTSPNPENASALALAIAQAERDGADIVVATDPDCDRMGVAVRDDSGALCLLTGNQIGSLLAWYRLQALFSQGVLNEANRSHATLIKTYVTSELQEALARHFGVGCVNTLTGFKYIGQKLGKYEAQLAGTFTGNYRDLPELETRALRLAHSTFFVFGGEESYGYLGADFLRDKDGNGAVVMFAELAAYAKSRNQTLPGLLDALYLAHGYYVERQHAIELQGADGLAMIRRLAADYSDRPPTEVDGVPVTQVRDFSNHEIHDEEGDLVPKERMLFVDLADGRAFAVRPSGTEPKIKYYLYHRPGPGSPPPSDAAALAAEKADADAGIESLRSWIVADKDRRLS